MVKKCIPMIATSYLFWASICHMALTAWPLCCTGFVNFVYLGIQGNFLKQLMPPPNSSDTEMRIKLLLSITKKANRMTGNLSRQW